MFYMEHTKSSFFTFTKRLLMIRMILKQFFNFTIKKEFEF